METIVIKLDNIIHTKHDQIRIIDELNFDLLKMKLKQREEGESWSDEQCDTAEIYYKRFLKLILLYPDRQFVPSKEIDTFWHYHILDTKNYYHSTINIFGEYLHHYPYLGFFGEEDHNNLIALYRETQLTYEETFQEPWPVAAVSHCDNGGSNCAGSCRN